MGSLPLRWLPEEDQSAFRMRESAFLLSLPVELRVRFQTRVIGPEGRSDDGGVFDALLKSGRPPREAALWVSSRGDSQDLKDLLVRFGVPILSTGEPPPLIDPDQPLIERPLHLRQGESLFTLLSPTVWPPALFWGWIGPLITSNLPMDMVLSLDPVPRQEAIHLLRHKARAFRSHKDRDPVFSRTFVDADRLLGEVLDRENRLFRVGLLVAVQGTPSSDGVRLLRRVARGEGFRFSPVPFGQGEALRVFQTESPHPPPHTRILDAETLTHLGLWEWGSDPSGVGGVPLGVDPDHRTIVVLDRRDYPNPSALVLGTPGSGKSTFAKVELLRTLGSLPGRAIVFDPEGEYRLLIQHLSGDIIDLSTPGWPINPLAAVRQEEVEGKLLRLPSLLVGTLGQGAEERVRMGLQRLYAKTLSPSLGDLGALLPEGDPVRERLWPVTEGPLKGLALGRPGLPDGLVTSFDLAGYDPQSVGLALPFLFEVLTSWIQGIAGKEPLYVVIDEVHLFLAHPGVRRGLLALMKRARKAGVVLTGITQNVGDFFLSEEGALFLSNAGLAVLFRQSPEDLAALKGRYRLPPLAVSWLERAGPGEGLLVSHAPRPIVLPLTEGEAALADTTPKAFKRRRRL